MERLLGIAILLSLLTHQAPGQHDASLLSGPQVLRERTEPPTLVRWDYSGRVVLIDAAPEEAAIALLDLDEPTARRVTEIIAARAAVFDRVVIESIDLFERFQAAEATSDARAKREIIGAFTRRLSPLIRRGALHDELYAALPRGQATMFAHLVDEYHRALVADARRQAEIEGRPFNAVEAALKIRGDSLGKAIERSFARTTQAGEREFEELIEKLDLRPESEQLIRARATDFAQKTKLNPTKGQSLMFVLRVLSELEPDERTKVIRRVIEINREQREAERAVTPGDDAMHGGPMRSDRP